MRHPDGIQGQSNVNAFLLPNENAAGRSVPHADRPSVVPQVTCEDVYPLSSHHGQLPRPEAVPLRIDARVRDSRIEPNPADTPASDLTERGHERPHIKVGMAVAECLPNSVEQ